MKIFSEVLIVILAFSVSCMESQYRMDDKIVNINESNYSDFENKSIIEYYSRDSLLYIKIFNADDSIFGEHCFLNKSGNRIDCCGNISIKVSKDKSGINGIIHSCYDDLDHKVELYLNKRNLKLVFVDNDHGFVPDSIILSKVR